MRRCACFCLMHQSPAHGISACLGHSTPKDHQCGCLLQMPFWAPPPQEHVWTSLICSSIIQPSADWTRAFLEARVSTGPRCVEKLFLWRWCLIQMHVGLLSFVTSLHEKAMRKGFICALAFSPAVTVVSNQLCLSMRHANLSVDSFLL